jgi:hypothetical protein
MRGVRRAAGAAMVADGLVGVDVPGRRKRAGLFGSLTLAAVGVVFVVLGIWRHGQHQPYAGGNSATGTVIRHAASHDGNRMMYSRVVRFSTTDGLPAQFTESESSTKRVAIGSTVRVSYLPGDPEGARVIPDTDWIPYGVIALGALVAVAGTVVFVIRLVTLASGIYLLARRS